MKFCPTIISNWLMMNRRKCSALCCNKRIGLCVEMICIDKSIQYYYAECFMYGWCQQSGFYLTTFTEQYMHYENPTDIRN